MEDNEFSYALFLAPATSSGITEAAYITLADFHEDNKNKIFTFICDVESIKVPEGSKLWRLNRFTTKKICSEYPEQYDASRLYAVKSDVLNVVVSLMKRYGIKNINDQFVVQVDPSSHTSPFMNVHPVDYNKWYLVMVEQDSNGFINWLGVKIPFYSIYKYIRLEELSTKNDF